MNRVAIGRLSLGLLAASMGSLDVEAQTYPVCGFGQSAGVKTYSSAAAFTAHASVLHVGACAATGNHCPQNIWCVCVENPQTKTETTMQNLCFAELAHAIWRGEGACSPSDAEKYHCQRQ